MGVLRHSTQLPIRYYTQIRRREAKRSVSRTVFASVVNYDIVLLFS